MKLLEAIRNISINDKELLENIIYALKERKDDVVEREPIDSGYYYERWEEKLSELDDIIEDLESLDDIENVSEKELKLKQIVSNIKFHQFEYGGLKRLKI